MKVIFHKNFYKTDYANNQASSKGRMESIMDELEKKYKIIQPSPGSFETISLAHNQDYITKIKENSKLYDMASLAAGGAVEAAEISMKGEATFACVRPPGHHANKDRGWGYCEFCNVAIALLNLKNKGKINSAFLLDFDAHTGDGTRNILSDWREVKILNPMAENAKDYLKIIEDYIKKIEYVDIIAVSAGFDTYKKDLGKKLDTYDFYFIGKMMRKLAKRMKHNRRFAVLEGGYYIPDLGKNVLSFCQGFE